jgi:hypothetical protein
MNPSYRSFSIQYCWCLVLDNRWTHNIYFVSIHVHNNIHSSRLNQLECQCSSHLTFKQNAWYEKADDWTLVNFLKKILRKQRSCTRIFICTHQHFDWTFSCMTIIYRRQSYLVGKFQFICLTTIKTHETTDLSLK